MGKTRRVILHPAQCMTLYNELLSTTISGRPEKDLAAADRELGKIVQSKQSDTLDGNVQFQRPEDVAEVDFSFKAMRGFKLVFIQCINGLGQGKPPVNYGFKTYNLMPIIEAFGKQMVQAVEKETKSDSGADEDVDWNKVENPEEVVDGDSVDLDGDKSMELEPPQEKPASAS